MQFDIRTLLVAVALATAFCAASRFLLWRMHPHVPGLARWAWAGVLAAIALFLFAGAGVLPNVLALSLAQAAIAAGLLLAWDGFRRFLGRKPLTPLFMTAPLAVMGLAVAIADLNALALLRALANATIIGGISAVIACELLRAPSATGSATRVTAYVYITNAIFFAARGLMALSDGAASSMSSAMLAASLLWWLCVTVAVTLGMALMTSERLQADLDHQASRDPLTGALNRRAFTLVAAREFSRIHRNHRPLSVLMMDLDHFKRVNDHLGHAAGDLILCCFVDVAAQMLRAEDTFCRFGGEEFVALLPDTDLQQALAAAERLRAAFAAEAAAQPLPSHDFALSVSIGIAQAMGEETPEDTLRRADAALYRAKAAGRDRCELAQAAPLPRACAVT